MNQSLILTYEANPKMSLTDQVVEHSQRHIRTDILAHADQSNTNDRERLEGVVLLAILF